MLIPMIFNGRTGVRYGISIPMALKCVEAFHASDQQAGFGKWDFGTDASHVTGALGIPSIGYSPMEGQHAL